MFYKIRNLATASAEPCPEPWAEDVSGIDFDVDPAEYKRRYRSARANHILVSPVEGANPWLRVTADNPPAALHGLIADFDGDSAEGTVETIMGKPPTPYLPAWASTTQSGKTRLVWLFEKPLTVISLEHAGKFLKEAALRIKCRKWGTDYDPKSENPAQYFDIGRSWRRVSDRTVPMDIVRLWDREVLSRLLSSRKGEAVKIPLDVVEEEINRRWPGRLEGTFAVGTRCLRFWDPDSDNRSGCTVMEEGIRVYVPHDKPFMRWSDIFGQDFVDAHSAAKSSPVLSNIWYNGAKNSFIRYLPEQRQYVIRNEAALKRDLKVELGLSSRPARGEEVSEIDSAIHTVTMTREIAFCAPFLFMPHGPVGLPDGRTAINTSMLRTLAMEPGTAGPRTWEEAAEDREFPFIHTLLSTMFMDDQKAADDLAETGVFRPEKVNPQLVVLLSWLAYFYQTATRLEPTQGQCLVIAGEAGRGKSFFGRLILGGLMGGAEDAQKYFLDGDRYTGGIVNTPVMLLDDCIGSVMDQRIRTSFTGRLKSVIATGAIHYEEKYRDAVPSLPWLGRVVVTCNSDPQSLSVLPDLDSSTRDKITMLRLGKAAFRFDLGAGGRDIPADRIREANRRRLSAELPKFARFLWNFIVPQNLSDPRFGVKAWQHPEMVAAAANNGYSVTVMDALYELFKPTLGIGKEPGIWVGTCRCLLDSIAEVSASAAREIGSARNLSHNLMILERAGYPVMMVRKKGGAQKWAIAKDIGELGNAYDQVKLRKLVAGYDGRD